MSKYHIYWILAAVIAVSSCTPKTTGVLRSPDVAPGTVGRPADPTVKEAEKKKTETVTKKAETQNIALLLPFQLDKMSTNALSATDVKRSELALDFYQGFQLGLEEVSKKAEQFSLEVVDSKDDPGQNALLARSEKISNATIIVGPVYPQEIKSFGNNFDNKNILQVSPLAATMPTEFNLPNLVSLTPPISVHMRAISSQVAENYRNDDVIIVYNANNNDHRQFINGFLSDIRERLPEGNIISVSSTTQMNEQLSAGRTHHIITGTTDRTQLRVLLDNMSESHVNGNFAFRLYGHPLWDRLDFSSFSSFNNFSPTITSESNLRPLSSKVRNFQQKYKHRFGIDPSDHSYKGYDAGTYFGSLLSKYGDDYANHVQNEVYEGIYNIYKFNRNERWGFVNFGLTIKTYRGGSFNHL